MLIHHLAAGRKPVDMDESLIRLQRSVKIIAKAQQRCVPAQLNQSPDVPEKRFVRLGLCPVDPRGFIVLCIGVVVTVLRLTEFVAGQQ